MSATATTPLTAACLADAVLERLDGGAAWTKGTLARDAEGRPTLQSAEAASWCLLGAMCEEAPNNARAVSELCAALEEEGVAQVAVWQDRPERTWDEIEAAVTAARARLS